VSNREALLQAAMTIAVHQSLWRSLPPRAGRLRYGTGR
jgi:hypothetical protein